MTERDINKLIAQPKDVDKLEGDFNQTISKLVKQVDDDKKVRRILAWSLGLDIILTIVLTAVTFSTVNNSKALSNQNQLSIDRTCKAINVTNAGQLKLWNYIFSIPPTTTVETTPEQKAAAQKQLDDFKAYINKTFAPREC